MAEGVRIQVMGNFLIYVEERRVENLISKSRKGAALMEYLILHRGQPVANQRLLKALWSEHKVSNPENALKTLVSRTRTQLNQIYPNLGGCIVSDRGAYHWENLDNMRVDVLELMGLFDSLKTERDKDVLRSMHKQVIALYKGDLFQTGELDEEAAYAEQLHVSFLTSVYNYIELLRQTEEYNEISAVCRAGLAVDSFDDRLHIELMKAMVNLNRTSEALTQYKHATNMTYRYLGAEPSEEMKAFYRQMSRARKTLKFNLDAIRNELKESSMERGAFVCDYSMFKEIYNLQMRNLERLGTTMFLGIIMIGDETDASIDGIRRDGIMTGLIDICREHLRKGDIITHFSPTVVALLLPTVNYETGTMVLERIRQLFYKRYPNSDIAFHSRLGILGRAAEDEQTEEEADSPND